MFCLLSHSEKISINSVSISNLSHQQLTEKVYEISKKPKDEFDFSSSNVFSENSFFYYVTINKTLKVFKFQSQKRDFCQVLKSKLITKTKWKERSIILTNKKILCISLKNKLKFSLSIFDIEDIFSHHFKNKNCVVKIITTTVQKERLISFTNENTKNAWITTIQKLNKK